MTRDQFLCEMMGEKWEVVTEEYACHCDISEGEEQDECVLDSHEYNENDCIYARKGMDKKTCEYWKPAKKNATNPNFSLWPDKGRLLDFVMGQEWWGYLKGFVFDVMMERGEYGLHGKGDFTKYLIDNLPSLVAEYQGWKEEEK